MRTDVALQRCICKFRRVALILGAVAADVAADVCAVAADVAADV